MLNINNFHMIILDLIVLKCTYASIKFYIKCKLSICKNLRQSYLFPNCKEVKKCELILSGMAVLLVYIVYCMNIYLSI